MRESVSAIFQYQDEIFVIKRQNYLDVFPGYHSFPGGKIDKDESSEELESSLYREFSSTLIHGLRREMIEELDFDLFHFEDLIEDFEEIGVAITPEFNPYRFKAHFFLVTLKEKPTFKVDDGEAESGLWLRPKRLLEDFKKAKVLAVPPTIKLISYLAEKTEESFPLNLTLPYDPEVEVPTIESIYGLKQFLPLSNTFPPAKRTNCFIIGDQEKVCIDPSPQDEHEYKKLKNSLEKVGFQKIFISHHHPDHHEKAPELALEFGVPMVMSQWTYKALLEKWGQEYLDEVPVEIVKEGDILCQSLGEDVLVYHVPGHDEGQLALAPRNLHWFFVGDLIQSIGTVVIGAPEGDMSKYFNSLQRVIDLNPRFIIPSHGISLGGVHKLKMTLKHRLEREQEVNKLLEEGLTPEEMLSRIYPKLAPKLRRYALKTINAHIKKLKTD